MQGSKISFGCSGKLSMRRVLLLCAVTCIASGANAVEVKPGKWAVSSETMTPMSTQPIIQQLEECVDENFDPVEEMVDQGAAQQCTITNVQDGANRITADLQCNMPGVGLVQGDMSFDVNDTSGTGLLNLSMNLGGQVLRMSTKWKGEYLGASCS